MPNFVSPGAMAGNAIQQFLMQREMDERKRVQEEFERRQVAEASQRAAAQLELQKQQEARIAAAQQEAQANLEQERAFRRATTIVDNSLPGDAVDDATAQMLTAQGYGGAMTRTQPTQGEHLGMDEAGIDQYAVVPGILEMRGGSKYLTAQAQREAQAANAEATRQATAERANESNQTRLAIAQMGADSRAAANAGRAETNALRNDLLRTQVDAANQKAADKEEAKVKARNAAKVRSQATIDVLKELADFDPATGKATLKPGTANLFGMQNPLARLKPGSDTNNAAAALNRLRGTAVIDLINEMKNQSATGATGFGSLSGSEGQLLERSSSELGSSMISDERAAAELERMYKMALQLYGTDDQTSQAGSAPRKYYDINGNPVQQ